jgi:hypothetical protein
MKKTDPKKSPEIPAIKPHRFTTFLGKTKNVSPRGVTVPETPIGEPKNEIISLCQSFKAPLAVGTLIKLESDEELAIFTGLIRKPKQRSVILKTTPYNPNNPTPTNSEEKTTNSDSSGAPVKGKRKKIFLKQFFRKSFCQRTSSSFNSKQKFVNFNVKERRSFY